MLARGSVVLLDLSPVVGHEQEGTRPCVVISDPEVSESQRYPMVCVIPITGTMGTGALYPVLRPGSSGLGRTSCALVDQIRSVDKRRITRVFGRLPLSELRAIDDGLRLFLGL